MRPIHRLLSLPLLIGLLASGGIRCAATAPAVVVHGVGFEATVLGWTSWYGSYSLAGVGQVWCIDHGLHAPDADLRYRPVPPPSISGEDRTAMAWVLGRYGATPTRVDAAAIMLVLHDLNNATYPYGPLDLSRMSAHQLAGFGGNESAVLHRATSLLADGRAHAHLRGPLTLTMSSTGRAAPGGEVVATARLRDRDGRGVPGIPLRWGATGGTLAAVAPVTGADGTARATVTATSRSLTVRADTTVPSLALEVWGPSVAPAQRVARSRPVPLHAASVATSTTRVRIHKHGDATPTHPVDGARFVLTTDHDPTRRIVARLVVGRDGFTPWATVPAGRYLVSEEVPPPGYQRLQPFPVDLAGPSDRTIDVTDRIFRTTLRLRKVDAETGKPLPGAIVELASDPDGDGVFTRVGAPITFGEDAVTLPALMPGDYRINELHAPDGYQRFTPRMVHLEPGSQVDLVLPDPRTTTTTSTTTSSTTTSTAAPPSTRPPSPPTSLRIVPPPTPAPLPPPGPPDTTPPTLPVTGSHAGALALLGLGTIALGAAVVVEAGRPREPLQGARPAGR